MCLNYLCEQPRSPALTTSPRRTRCSMPSARHGTPPRRGSPSETPRSPARPTRSPPSGSRSSASSSCSPRRAARSSAARPSAGPRLIEQLELQLAELEESAAEEETAAEIAAPKKRASPSGGSTRKPARRPLPENLPRERIVYPAPCACPKCGGPVRKLGEDVTETLECEPRRWKVVEHVREKVSCRCCEAISQPPAPSHPIARGRAGSEPAGPGAGREVRPASAAHPAECDLRPRGVELDVSTLADWVGSSTASLMPLVLEVRTHVFAAERLHGDDTTVPVLAKERTKIGRVWGYVRDDRPFGGPDPPAVAFFYSPDRSGEHPERHLAGFAGILQADAYAGFNRLYAPEARAGADPRGRLLGARATQTVRARGGQQGADRGRGGAADRRAVRDRARASTASLPRSAWRSGRSGRSRWCSSSRPGCASSTRGSRASRRSARRSPTPSTTGRRSPGSLRTGGSA